MTNVKPGQRAIIIGTRTCPENIGKVVTVIGETPEEDPFGGFFWNGIYWKGAGPEDKTWIVETEGSSLISKSLLKGTCMHHSARPYLDSYLRPLLDDGDDTDEEDVVLDREKQTETV